jgi:carbon-monoxide dehydrogenase catalytic subunit
MEKSTDKATISMVAQAERQGISVVWDRFERQLPQCGFGESGLCCRNCMQGPCRIDPFGEGPQVGVCGAGPDTMVARGLARAVAAGTASHGGHAKHIAHTLLKSAAGEAPDYPIRDEAKLRAVAARIGVESGSQSVNEIAAAVAQKALEAGLKLLSHIMLCPPELTVRSPKSCTEPLMVWTRNP